MSKLYTFTDGAIPVHYTHIPGDMNPVSIELVVLAGSGDDAAVGAPGIMHWFEHVPFRGTVAFPEGNIELTPGFSRHGGELNAYTSNNITNYHAFTPKQYVRNALTAIVDLAARPLLRDKDIDAERTIIKEEIRQRLSSVEGFSQYHLQHRLWGDHPFGHHTLGTPESLDSMTAENLRHAHKQLYGKSTMQLFIAGTIDPQEVHALANELTAVIPDANQSERYTPPSYGTVPAWQPGKEVIPTTFDASLVYLFFPVGKESWQNNGVNRYGAIDSILTTGGLAAPLARILRTERNLCYQTYAFGKVTPDGGYVGLAAKCKKENIQGILDAYGDVLNLPEIRSPERWNFCMEGLIGRHLMRIPHPAEATGSMIESLFTHGTVLDEEVMFERAKSITHEQALETLSSISLDAAKTIIFEGQ